MREKERERESNRQRERERREKKKRVGKVVHTFSHTHTLCTKKFLLTSMTTGKVLGWKESGLETGKGVSE